MALHFSKQELAARRRRACRAMAERGLDGLLIFRQESMYYLTGYDTSGYSMFQGMYLGADGKLALCTRSGRPAPGPHHVRHQGHPHLA
jgi:Xaa-Pro dipeptidase